MKSNEADSARKLELIADTIDRAQELIAGDCADQRLAQILDMSIDGIFTGDTTFDVTQLHRQIEEKHMARARGVTCDQTIGLAKQEA